MHDVHTKTHIEYRRICQSIVAWAAYAMYCTLKFFNLTGGNWFLAYAILCFYTEYVARFTLTLWKMFTTENSVQRQRLLVVDCFCFHRYRLKRSAQSFLCEGAFIKRNQWGRDHHHQFYDQKQQQQKKSYKIQKSMRLIGERNSREKKKERKKKCSTETHA